MLLSVIIPVYNVEKYLDKCVQSVVDQTYSDLEIILVDDGSTDSSGMLCDNWKEKDRRISVIHKNNGGLSSARNTGIAAAKGDFISFIDSDDFIESEMYETMIYAQLRSGKDISCCGRIVDVWGKYEKEEFVISKETVYTQEETIKQILLLNIIDVSSCDKIYKSTLFENLRYPEGKISEDAAIIFDLVKASNGFVHVGKPFYHYIYRLNSISKTTYNHKKHDVYTNCVNTQAFINNNYPNLNKICKIYCAQTALCLLESMYEDKKSIKNFHEDYEEYKSLFRKGLIYLLGEKNIDLKIKIKSIFMYTHCFNLFIFLNAIRKNLNSGRDNENGKY